MGKNSNSGIYFIAKFSFTMCHLHFGIWQYVYTGQYVVLSDSDVVLCIHVVGVLLQAGFSQTVSFC